jgi:hypothetical protein
MATLEIDFHCLCLFVPEPDNKTVHVLMPASEHRLGGGGVSGLKQGGPADDGEDGAVTGSLAAQAGGSAGGAGGAGPAHTPHVVRIMDATRPGAGRKMEGWMLELGPKKGSADTDLSSIDSAGAKLADLTQLSGFTASPLLIDDTVDPQVVSRVVLRAGKAKDAVGAHKWDIGDEIVRLATRVTWRIENFEGDLIWTPWGASGRPPLMLGDVKPTDGVFRIAIFHTLARALPPNSGTIPGDEVGEHFKHFYKAIGHANPKQRELPKPPAGRAFTDDCPSSRASLG